MKTDKEGIQEIEVLIDNKRKVASSLVFLGMSHKEAALCADWYCDKIEWGAMPETGLFSMDNQYDSIDQFKYYAYFWFLIFLMDLNKDKDSVEYMLHASWEEGDGCCDEKSKRLKEIIMRAVSSEELMTEEVAMILKMDFETAKEMYLANSRKGQK